MCVQSVREGRYQRGGGGRCGRGLLASAGVRDATGRGHGLGSGQISDVIDRKHERTGRDSIPVAEKRARGG